MTNNFQSIAYYTTLNDDLVACGGVLKFDASNSVRRKAGICRLSLYDPIGDIADTCEKGVDISLAWSINAGDQVNLFAGKIAGVTTPERERVDIVAANAYNLALTRKLTMTLSKMSATEMLSTLAKSLGIPATGIAEHDDTVNHLPLYRMTVDQAVAALNRKLKVDYDAYVNEDGAFVWAPRDLTADPAHEFEEGVDLLEFDEEGKRFTTWGVDLRLRQIITILDHEDVTHTGIVTDLRYAAGDEGSIIEGWYEAI